MEMSSFSILQKVMDVLNVGKGLPLRRTRQDVRRARLEEEGVPYHSGSISYTVLKLSPFSFF